MVRYSSTFKARRIYPWLNYDLEERSFTSQNTDISTVNTWEGSFVFRIISCCVTYGIHISCSCQLSGDHMIEPLLFQRAKQSDMIQGVLDMCDLLDLECQKINRFYPNNLLYNGAHGLLLMQIQSLRQQTFYIQPALQELRERGL